MGQGIVLAVLVLVARFGVALVLGLIVGYNPTPLLDGLFWGIQFALIGGTAYWLYEHKKQWGLFAFILLSIILLGMGPME